MARLEISAEDFLLECGDYFWRGLNFRREDFLRECGDYFWRGLNFRRKIFCGNAAIIFGVA